MISIGEEDKQTKGEGLTLEELEAQVGELLPKRVEMRHHRHHHGGVNGNNFSCGNGVINVAGCGLPVTVTL